MKELYLLEKTVTEDGCFYTIFDSFGYSDKRLPKDITEEEAIEILRIYQSSDLESTKRVIRYGRENQKSYCLYEWHYKYITSKELKVSKEYVIAFNKNVLHTKSVDDITEDAMIEWYESVINEKLTEQKTNISVIKID